MTWLSRFACLLVGGLIVLPVRAENKTPTTRPGGQKGTIICDYWRELPGGSVVDLLNAPGFPAHPTHSDLKSSFEIAQNDETNYGAALRGFLYPPVTGDYTFWIATDDGGLLNLSTSEDPAKRAQIAECPFFTGEHEWTKFPQQKSKPIHLEAGKAYYIEGLLKQEAGPGHISVGWQLPDGKQERPIPGMRLSPAGPAKPMPPIKTTVTLDPKLKPATQPYHNKFPLGATVERNGREFRMSYLVFLPKNYNQTTDRRPMFIFLCGNSHQGTDLSGITNEGPGWDLIADGKLRDWFPFVALFPQPPPDTRWDTPGMADAVVGLIDQVIKQYRIDPDRVYLTGLSMGGKGTWLVAHAAPDRFAFITPISAVSVYPDQAIEHFKNLPCWIICGADDGDFTNGCKKMFEVMHGGKCPVDLTVVPNEGHGVWGRYYPTQAFYEVLLKHRRGAQVNAATTQPTK